MKINFNLPIMNFATMGRVSDYAKLLSKQQYVMKANSNKDSFPNAYSKGADGHPHNSIDEDARCLSCHGDRRVVIPIDDQLRQKTLEHVRDSFRYNDGMGDPEKADQFYAEINRDFINKLPPEKRISAMETVNQVRLTEAQRIVDYIKTKDPTWDFWKPIKPGLAEEAINSKPTLNKVI